jgi:hypothetical protein
MATSPRSGTSAAKSYSTITIQAEDGDKPEKRDFCQVHGIEYRVLKRIPKEGLTPRSSTVLRGF